MESWLPFHTSDDFLRDLTGASGGSEKLRQTFTALPPGSLSAVYREDDDGAALMAYLVSYLAWPREVDLSATKGGAASEAAAREAGRFVGTIYCRLQPPAGAPISAKLAEGMLLVRDEPSTESGR